MKHINSTYLSIKSIIEEAREYAYKSINFAMVRAYWNIGRLIVEEELKGKKRAGYGKTLIQNLSKKLTKAFGRGFNERNLWHMKNFYLIFPKLNAVRTELSWTHYRLLMRIDEPNTR